MDGGVIVVPETFDFLQKENKAKKNKIKNMICEQFVLSIYS